MDVDVFIKGVVANQLNDDRCYLSGQGDAVGDE
jgi:hypothetical protein